MCSFFILKTFYFLAMLRGMWEFSSLARDKICTPCIGSVEAYPPDHRGSPTCSF